MHYAKPIFGVDVLETGERYGALVMLAGRACFARDVKLFIL